MRIFNRLHKAISLLEYFSSQDWEWNSENLSMLMSQLTPEDRKVSGSMCVCVRLIGPKKRLQECLILGLRFSLSVSVSREPSG